MQTAGRKTVVAIEAVIDFISQIASKFKNGAVKLFEDFKGLVEDILNGSRSFLVERKYPKQIYLRIGIMLQEEEES